MKKLLSLALVLTIALPLCAFAQGALKIGTIDMNRAFKEYGKTKEAEKKINDARDAAKKEFDDRADQYKKALEEVNNLNKQLDAPALSADAKTQKAKERDDKINNIKNMEREINEFRQTRERQLQEQALRMREGIVKEITDIVMDRVKTQSMDLVFDKSGMSLNGVPLVMYSRDNYDFTNDVIAALNWSGITAAMADVWFHRGDDGSFVLEGKGRTVGLARVLWRFDVNYRSVAHAQTLRPIEVHQTENIRSKRIETNLKFSDAGVTSTRTEANRPKSPPKNFALENLNDLHSALLYLRSQPLRDGSVFRLAVYPANSAYVGTRTVIGHERVKVHAGTYSAIKLDLRLQRINKKNQLEPHRKFKRATAWVSDDNDRLLLRVEAQIFVGTIATEIQSVRFDQPVAAT